MMKAQAQFTIHSLNDVIASTTAPSSPYKGQLWVNTSYSPPRTFVYNGSAWKEQNGTDTLRSNSSSLTTKSNTMRSHYGFFFRWSVLRCFWRFPDLRPLRLWSLSDFL